MHLNTTTRYTTYIVLIITKYFLSNIICAGFSFFFILYSVGVFYSSSFFFRSIIHSCRYKYIHINFFLKQWQQQYIKHFCLHHCFYFISLFVYNMNAYCGGNTTLISSALLCMCTYSVSSSSLSVFYSLSSHFVSCFPSVPAPVSHITSYHITRMVL